MDDGNSDDWKAAFQFERARAVKAEKIATLWEDRWAMNGAWIAAVAAGEKKIAQVALRKRIEAEDALRALGVDV